MKSIQKPKEKNSIPAVRVGTDPDSPYSSVVFVGRTLGKVLEKLKFN